MNASLCRQCCLIVLVTLAWGWTAGALLAQAPDQLSGASSSLTVVKARVPVGDVVSVTDAAGVMLKGKLAEVTDEALRVSVRADVRTLAAADIRRIQWQQPDSPLNGVLIGAAIGAIPGVYWLVVDPNECFGMCPEEYASIAVGAIVGGLVDHVIKRNVTVHAAEASCDCAKSVTMGPLVMRGRKGVQIAVKF